MILLSIRHPSQKMARPPHRKKCARARSKPLPRDGKTYRLLSEAEYEYTTRPGRRRPIRRAGSSARAMPIARAAAADGTTNSRLPLVHSPANAFALYDIVGQRHYVAYRRRQPRHGTSTARAAARPRPRRTGRPHTPRHGRGRIPTHDPTRTALRNVRGQHTRSVGSVIVLWRQFRLGSSSGK